MKWVWVAVGDCSQLMLQQDIGLKVVECSFGYVDCKTNRAYDYWNCNDLGVFESQIEAKRNLLKHIKEKITSAQESSKPGFL